ncbi:MAG: hypothetical protein EBZ48_06560 [Proteobacteria bacterium]|nr:hypothetical protein [Pseudomonadota bacterium]
MTTKTKKEPTKRSSNKIGTGDSGAADGSEALVTSIATKEELKSFLLSIRDKMAEQSAASIFAVSAVHHILTLPNIYSILDNENKEIARDIWLRLKQSGMQLRNPPLLFRPEEDSHSAG